MAATEFGHRETGRLATTGRFNRQPAQGLLSCANNLISCASIAGLGQQIANEQQQAWWPSARIQTDEHPVDSERHGRDRPPGMCALASIRHSAALPLVESRADH